jgi:hypothetical protein
MDKETFLSVYFRHLIEAKNANPEKYNWKHADVLEVFKRMSDSFSEGTYCRHGEALKKTCKELKIKHTRQAIDAIFQKGG